MYVAFSSRAYALVVFIALSFSLACKTPAATGGGSKAGKDTERGSNKDGQEKENLPVQKGSSKTPSALAARLDLILSDSLLRQAHVGFALYDPATATYVHQYQADKYFVPASNVKIISCYAGMKYLGPRLKGLEWIDLDTAVLLIPTGDPSLLHPDYPNQPVADFLRSITKPIYITDLGWKSTALGSGWSWDDFSAYYMAERSPLPVYGNVIRWHQSTNRKEKPAYPGDTLDVFFSSEPEVNFPVDFTPPAMDGIFEVNRLREENRFIINTGKEKEASIDVPFLTRGLETARILISDTLHRELRFMDSALARKFMRTRKVSAVYTQPLDSILRPMMHRSDNFFAEQTLLMAGYALTGTMSDHLSVARMLSADLGAMPHAPRWADGSGLSRYNLFTPADFVFVLDRMQREFGMDRIRGIFPGSGMGTLANFLKDQPGKVFAKTGTLSGVVALSGFVQAKNGRWLIFSMLVNNHRQSAREIRNRMEDVMREIISLAH
jgi:serine-type D-Ala-D-Ala carboxypeptidase/endopeptidase (penicillin-binding protein 4)